MHGKNEEARPRVPQCSVQHRVRGGGLVCYGRHESTFHRCPAIMDLKEAGVVHVGFRNFMASPAVLC